MQTVMRRAAEGSLRWVVTLFPNEAYARDAEMSLTEYEDFVFGACMPDPEDPVGFWGRLFEPQQHIVDWLHGKSCVRVLSSETDLKLSISDRVFINSDGRHNMPSGEIFTGPVEDSVEGSV